MIRTLAATLFLFSLNAGAAEAHTSSSHSQASTFAVQVENQVRAGNITPQEAMVLRQESLNLQRAKRLVMADGRITLAERMRIRRLERKLTEKYRVLRTNRDRR